jgi:hypothetical protein
MFMVDVPNKPQPQRLSTENHLDYRKYKKIIDKGMYFHKFTAIYAMTCVIMFSYHKIIWRMLTRRPESQGGELVGI